MQLIDRNYLLKMIMFEPQFEFCGEKEKDVQTTLRAIEECPTVDAEQVNHGYWIHTGETNILGGHQHKCSVCGYTLMVSPMCDNENYCCNCGARMDEEKNERNVE